MIGIRFVEPAQCPQLSLQGAHPGHELGELLLRLERPLRVRSGAAARAARCLLRSHLHQATPGPSPSARHWSEAQSSWATSAPASTLEHGEAAPLRASREVCAIRPGGVEGKRWSGRREVRPCAGLPAASGGDVLGVRRSGFSKVSYARVVGAAGGAAQPNPALTFQASKIIPGSGFGGVGIGGGYGSGQVSGGCGSGGDVRINVSRAGP